MAVLIDDGLAVSDEVAAISSVSTGEYRSIDANLEPSEALNAAGIAVRARPPHRRSAPTNSLSSCTPAKYARGE